MRSSGRYFSSLVAIILGLSSLISVALAQDAPAPSADDFDVRVAIYPQGGEDGERFELTADPGQSIEAVAMISNFGAEPIELRTFVSHIVPVTNGGLVVPESGTELEGTALWFEYPTEEFTLQPGEVVERTMRISVPDGTPPGEYVNAVAIETVNPINQADGGPFEQFLRKIVSVYVRVPGEVTPDFSIGEPEVLVRQGQASIRVPVVNEGNVRLDLTGSISLLDSAGTVLVEGQVLTGPIYMGQTVPLQVPIGVPPEPGDGYQVSVDVTDSNSEESRTVEPVAVVVPEDSNPIEAAPVAFNNVIVEPNADPIVFANVSVDIEISGTSHRSTRLKLSVFHDGEHVEDFVLADNLALDPGTNTVTQRYLPGTNWESGTYTFSLTLETVSSGQTTPLFAKSDVATLEVP